MRPLFGVILALVACAFSYSPALGQLSWWRPLTDSRLPDPGAAGTVMESVGGAWSPVTPAYVTPFVVGTEGRYATVQAAVDAAAAAGGGLVHVQPGSFNEVVTLPANVVVQGSGQFVTSIRRVVLDAGEAGGARSSHEAGLRDLQISPSTGEWGIDDTGSTGAQLVTIERVRVFCNDDALGVRLQNGDTGLNGLRTRYPMRAVYVWGGAGASEIVSLDGAWVSLDDGALTIEAGGDAPAAVLSGAALINAERGEGSLRVSGTLTVEDTAQLVLARLEVYIGSVPPIRLDGILSVTAIGELVAVASTPTAALISGAGMLAWTRVEASGFIDVTGSTATNYLLVLATAIAPGAGGGPAIVPVTGGAAAYDASNIVPSDWRTELELEDLATTARAALREVSDPTGVADGWVLTADGADGYGWEASAGGAGEANVLGLDPDATGESLVGDQVGTTLNLKGLLSGEGVATSTFGDDVRFSLDFDSLGPDATPDGATSYVAVYDSIGTGYEKVLLDDLPGGGGGGTTFKISAYYAGAGDATDTQCAGSTTTPLLYDTEEADVGGNYNPATGVITIPSDGFFCFRGSLGHSGNSNVYIVLQADTGGGYVTQRGGNQAGIYDISAMAHCMSLSAGDLIRFACFNLTGTAARLRGTAFSGTRAEYGQNLMHMSAWGVP